MITEQEHLEPSRSIDSSDAVKTLVVRLSLVLEVFAVFLGAAAAFYRWM